MCARRYERQVFRGKRHVGFQVRSRHLMDRIYILIVVAQPSHPGPWNYSHPRLSTTMSSVFHIYVVGVICYPFADIIKDTFHEYIYLLFSTLFDSLNVSMMRRMLLLII